MVKMLRQAQHDCHPEPVEGFLEDRITLSLIN